MAGRGQRFADDGFKQIKPLIDINGTPMIAKAINSLGIFGHYYFIVRDVRGINKLVDILEKSVPPSYDRTIILVDKLTEGPACTAAMAEEYINNKKELMIVNCDQIMWWDGDAALDAMRYRGFHGVLVTYTSNVTKNSYARLDMSGRVIEVKEKEVISNISLNGIHYWRKGRYFIESYNRMLEKDDRAPNGEFYVSITYQHMIKLGYNVGIYHIPNFQHHAVGTPDDLRQYIKDEKDQLKKK